MSVRYTVFDQTKSTQQYLLGLDKFLLLYVKINHRTLVMCFYMKEGANPIITVLN